MSEYQKDLESLGYLIEDAPKAAGLYTPLVSHGNVVYASGMVPMADGELVYKGSVPSQISVAEATKAAELCAANLLRVVHRELGSLSRIDKLLKVTGFVNSDPDFTEQHIVINGASKLFIDVLGEAGAHARSAVGMANLPLGAAVEVEMVFTLK